MSAEMAMEQNECNTERPIYDWSHDHYATAAGFGSLTGGPTMLSLTRRLLTDVSRFCSNRTPEL
jgi:hypothetical protein